MPDRYAPEFEEALAGAMMAAVFRAANELGVEPFKKGVYERLRQAAIESLNTYLLQCPVADGVQANDEKDKLRSEVRVLTNRLLDAQIEAERLGKELTQVRKEAKKANAISNAHKATAEAALVYLEATREGDEAKAEDARKYVLECARGLKRKLNPKPRKPAKRIEILSEMFGNSPGDVVRVVQETEGEVYYYDGFRRYCYLWKKDEGKDFRYVVWSEEESRWIPQGGQ